jgi:hypothetical protein
LIGSVVCFSNNSNFNRWLFLPDVRIVVFGRRTFRHHILALTTSSTLLSTNPTIIIVRSSVFHDDCIVLSTIWFHALSHARLLVSIRKGILMSGQGGSFIYQSKSVKASSSNLNSLYVLKFVTHLATTSLRYPMRDRVNHAWKGCIASLKSTKLKGELQCICYLI